MNLSRLKPKFTFLREKISYCKQKILANKSVSGFILFVKSDGMVIEARNLFGQIHPYLHDKFYTIWARIFAVAFVFVLLYGLFWRAPFSFPDHSIATVEKGAHLSEIADSLERDHFIFSSLWFKVWVTFVGGQREIIAGDYYFEEPLSVFGVVRRVLRGNFGLTQMRVYIPEGLNSREMADLISTYLPHFDKAEFIALAEENEGYLFPDTYFFTPNQKPAEIVALMRENFARQTDAFKVDIVKSGKSLEDIVIMASIIQDEAGSDYDKRIVAGILWRRIRMGMPLQADSTLRYVSGKASHEITKSELEDKGNPYNSYANKGLPPTPISSPGIESIKAAIAPTNTDYLYFLSDSSGRMYYAADFEGHKRNREAYLR